MRIRCFLSVFVWYMSNCQNYCTVYNILLCSWPLKVKTSIWKPLHHSSLSLHYDTMLSEKYQLIACHHYDCLFDDFIKQVLPDKWRVSALDWSTLHKHTEKITSTQIHGAVSQCLYNECKCYPFVARGKLICWPFSNFLPMRELTSSACLKHPHAVWV